MRGGAVVNLSPDALRTARTAAQLSVADLATAAEISESTLRAWETGRAQPGSAALKRVADLLRVTVASLIGEEPDLTTWRYEHGWTVTEAATRADLSDSTLTRAERGLERLADRTRDALATLYNQSPETITEAHQRARAARIAKVTERA
jgi:transcriptional regulator with XRE-family HTH domain